MRVFLRLLFSVPAKLLARVMMLTSLLEFDFLNALGVFSFSKNSAF